ncbi:MAG TPA: secretin N-terminal domain-containing protein [Thermoanaerobaculia bacterium]
MKRITGLLLAMTFVCGTAFAEPPAEKTLTVRAFQFRHKAAEKAAAAIKNLVSAEGSISLQPSTNSLSVTDRPENLKAIAAAIAAFDTPAQNFNLEIRLVAASRVKPEQAPRIADDMKDIASKLSMMRYNAFEELGEASFLGREGEPGQIDMDKYRAEFRLGEYDAASNTIKVSDLRISKLENDQLTQLHKSTLNLKLGQQLIIGAAKAPESQRALMIVITARR